MAEVNTSNMAAAIKGAYDRRLMMRALPRLLHGRFGRPATFDGYNTWEIRRWESFSDTSISAMGEGATPVEHSAPQISTYTLTPLWYGAWVQYTDKMKIQSYDPVISETSAILGEHAGLMIDNLIRDELVANATIDYAGGAAARTELDIANDKIAYADIVYDVATLEANGAQPADGGFYPIILHPHSWATLMQDSTFVTLFTREGGESVRSGLVGTILNCKLYLSSNAKEWADGGQNSTEDIYSAMFIGNESYGLAGMTGMAPNWSADGGPGLIWGELTGRPVSVAEIIMKDLGQTGFDPLDLRGTIGWKATHDQIVLNVNWIISLEHCNDFS
jgi:N4-gp56 family major capsid protein